MSGGGGAGPTVLRARAALLDQVRTFFAERGGLEVDVPVLQGGANLDPGMRSFRLDTASGPRWLPTSPEHPLKRLVAAGCGDVWTLAPAFRAGELGPRHAPEFRMLEWYRVGWDERRLLTETVELLARLTGLGGGLEELPYREVFRRHAGLDPARSDPAAWSAALGPLEEAAQAADGSLDTAAACDLLFAERVEPHLGRGRWTAVVDWPPRLAAQAQLRREVDGEPAAARFEVFRDGLELANGYLELTDVPELEARLAAEAGRRGGTDAPDLRFLAAMRAGLPACAGVAVGFDRVVMLALGLGTVAEAQAFPWDRA